MEVIEVAENTPLPGLLPAELEFLRERIPHRLTHRRGGWVITRVVGHIVLSGGRVLRIFSEKAPTSALLAWMTYADPTIGAIELGRLCEGLADAGDYSGLIVEIYARALLAACARVGLVRSYRPVQTCSPYVRGRIDFQRMVVRAHDHSRLPCATWERDSDTALNRFLAAALARADQDPYLQGASSASVAAARRHFSGISPFVDEALRRGALPLTRAEAPFATAYALARLILGGYGVGDGPVLPGVAFLIDLERLFERAVQVSFARASRGCEIGAGVMYEHERAGRRSSGLMRLDLLCHTANGPLVVDAKFKHRVSAANLQQMVTYCHLTGARRAVLVLPGSASGPESYRFVAPDGDTIVVKACMLDTSARTSDGWRRNGAALVDACERD